VETIRVGTNPQDITWAPDGRFAYTINVNDNSVSVINAQTKTVTGSIPTGDSPISIAARSWR
jgi:YVTN family beta-propeller protein